MRLQRFSISFFLFLALNFALKAQSSPIPSIIALRDGEYSIFNEAGSPMNLGDGVIVFDTYGQNFLYARDSLRYFNGQNGQLISEEYGTSCPPQFSADGNSVIYLVKNDNQVNVAYREYYVMRKLISNEAEPEILGRLRFNIVDGGGDGRYYPNDVVFWDDVGNYRGISSHFEVTDYGFFNSHCLFEGLSMTSLTNPQPQFIDNFWNWVISPDGNQIVGSYWQGSDVRQLALLDLATNRIEVIDEILGDKRIPLQFYWADENTLYYSISQFSDTDYGLAGFDFHSDNGIIPPHTASIQIIRFDLSSRESEIIYEQANSWAVGRIVGDESHLYFSVIPDGMSLAEAYSAGSLALDDEESARALILPDVYRIPLVGGEAELIYEDVLHFFLLRND